MPSFMPGIHVLNVNPIKDVDGRDEPGLTVADTAGVGIWLAVTPSLLQIMSQVFCRLRQRHATRTL